MAKIPWTIKPKKRLRPKENKENKEKNDENKNSKKESFENKIWHIGAAIITASDEFGEELDEIFHDGKDGFVEVCGALITGYDNLADLIGWAIGKTFILGARKIHDIRVKILENRKNLVKHTVVVLLACLAVIALFSTATDYEYSYNGRALGIVKEQRDVLEVLSLASSGLSAEYGSNISIDPETDITFKPVISFGKEIDDPDTVLKRFTYMGDIQAQAFAIMVDGEKIISVESQKIAEDVLQAIKDIYVKESSKTKYEYVGFDEDVKIQAYNTTLANISSKAAAIKKIKSGGQEESTYEVKAGDTLYGICEKLGVSLKELQEMNSSLTENTVLHIGDKFVAKQEVPLLTVKTVEVSTFAEKVEYEVVTKKSKQYYQGDKVVSREGEDGKARVTARITKLNGKTISRKNLETVVIKEPINKVIIKGTKKVPPTKGTGSLIRPVSVGIYRGFGMRWGRMHEGVDLAAPTGTAIKAADGGVVTKAGWSGAYGYRIVIDHGGNTKTLYAHCSRMYVSAGQKVYKGQTIGAVGSTGRSTGAHCHFEVIKNGVHVNPANYI